MARPGKEYKPPLAVVVVALDVPLSVMRTLSAMAPETAPERVYVEPPPPR